MFDHHFRHFEKLCIFKCRKTVEVMLYKYILNNRMNAEKIRINCCHEINLGPSSGIPGKHNSTSLYTALIIYKVKLI